MEKIFSLKVIILIALVCGFSNIAYSSDQNDENSFYQDCFEAYPYSLMEEDIYDNDSENKIFLLAKNDHLTNLALMDDYGIQNTLISDEEDC